MKEVQKKAAQAKDFTKDVIELKEGSSTDEKTGISYATKDLIETDTDFLDEKTLKTVKKMKNGDISDVLETKDGYYVIKMVNNNDPKAYEVKLSRQILYRKHPVFLSFFKLPLVHIIDVIKGQYTTEIQPFWKGRVTLGSMTYDDTVAQ